MFNFFAKKHKPGCAFAKKKLRDEAEHRRQILERFKNLEKVIAAMDKRQKEMVIQLEELDSLMNEDTAKVSKSFLTLSDIIYDFYCYSKKDEHVSDQAHMMWQNAVSTLKKSDIEVVQPTGDVFNYHLHIAHSVTNDPEIPNEHVSETLKCGYVSNDTILRRATVMVNKTSEGASE